ncbi:MAG: ion channel [Candidatus Latescibacter sp.]|nr:ion channel [Candidatus Latescibacter sp.]
MMSSSRNVLKQGVLSKVWRFIARNHRVRWIFLLSLFMFLLVALIRAVEMSANRHYDSVWDSIYWFVVTIATVGYGDITPRTTGGKLLTIPLIMLGVILMSFLTGTIASILTATRIREGRGLQKLNLQNHVVICGYNSNIERVIGGIVSTARSLPDIVLINTHPETEITNLIERFSEASIRFVRGDYTAEPTLMRASIVKASSAIILADPGPDGQAKPDDRTLIAALAIKSVARNVEVCAELLDAANEVHLKRAGVDQIIFSGEFNGFLLSSAVMTPGITQALREIMCTDRGSVIKRAPIPHELVGKSFQTAVVDFMDHQGSILLGIITEKKTFNMEDMLKGDKDIIDDFIRRKFEDAGRSLEIESKGRMTVVMNPGKNYHITEDDFAVILTSHNKEMNV